MVSMSTEPQDSKLKKIFAQRIRHARLQRDWTRQTLANKSGVNIYNIKRFENQGDISFANFLALCEPLGALPDLSRVLKPRVKIDQTNGAIKESTRKRGSRQHLVTTE
jgi:transcriptional regulator with XRE-family HTH domain